MTPKMATRHYDVLNAIRTFKAINDYSPTIRDLMEMTNVSSTSMMNFYLGKLEEENLIQRAIGISRSIQLTGYKRIDLPRSEHYERRAKEIGERSLRADGRKHSSAKTNAKKAEAGRKGKGASALIAKAKTEHAKTLEERIKLVVEMAQAVDHSTEVVWERKGYTSLHAVKVG